MLIIIKVGALVTVGKKKGDVCDVRMWYQKPVRVRDWFERMTVEGRFDSMSRSVRLL